MEKHRPSSQETASIQASRTLSDAELLQGGAQYVPAEHTGEPVLSISAEQYSKLKAEMDSLLEADFYTVDAIQNGAVTSAIELTEAHGSTGNIEYDFEVEMEQRINIEPLNTDDFTWENHVVDTYDASGRARVRVKNGSPRLSLKVPLLSKDTDTAKACVRLEFKPLTNQQEEDLFSVRDLVMQEAGTQVREKWGARMQNEQGQTYWINRDADNNWWFEVDEGVDYELPAGVIVKNLHKSSIKI